MYHKTRYTIKKHIPIFMDERRPGYMEADPVAHCGTSTAGNFIYTLHIVDIAPDAGSVGKRISGRLTCDYRH